MIANLKSLHISLFYKYNKYFQAGLNFVLGFPANTNGKFSIHFPILTHSAF